MNQDTYCALKKLPSNQRMKRTKILTANCRFRGCLDLIPPVQRLAKFESRQHLPIIASLPRFERPHAESSHKDEAAANQAVKKACFNVYSDAAAIWAKTGYLNTFFEGSTRPVTPQSPECCSVLRRSVPKLIHVRVGPSLAPDAAGQTVARTAGYAENQGLCAPFTAISGR